MPDLEKNTTPVRDTDTCKLDAFYFLFLVFLMLYVPVNSNGNVGTLPPFYGTFTQHKDVIALKICFINITTQLS